MNEDYYLYGNVKLGYGNFTLPPILIGTMFYQGQTLVDRKNDLQFDESKARKRIDDSGYDIRLEIDGGVKVDNIREIKAAGADMFVAGSAIFSQPDYKTVIDEMRAELAKA